MTTIEFWDLFGQLEHERLDYKRGIPSELQDAIPAMAMTDGGFLVLGVDDNRKLVGCPLSQSTFDRVMRYANQCTVAEQRAEAGPPCDAAIASYALWSISASLAIRFIEQHTRKFQDVRDTRREAFTELGH